MIFVGSWNIDVIIKPLIKIINKELIIEAYIFLRKNNQSIPSETLEFMKDAAIEKFEEVRSFNKLLDEKEHET